MFKFIATAILATLALALPEPTPSASFGIPGKYPASSGVSEEYASSAFSVLSEEYTSSPSPSPSMEDGDSSCCGSVESAFSSDSSDFILFGEEAIDFGDARISGYPDSGYDTFSLESGSLRSASFEVLIFLEHRFPTARLSLLFLLLRLVLQLCLLHLLFPFLPFGPVLHLLKEISSSPL
ncbi:hypothetical protein BDB01DRAFT_837578 [Pilobolus umbonatus]|nr:hypothetical protein BDB01DRAFT_837578 [Pilobolus umbonatus]